MSWVDLILHTNPSDRGLTGCCAKPLDKNARVLRLLALYPDDDQGDRNKRMKCNGREEGRSNVQDIVPGLVKLHCLGTSLLYLRWRRIEKKNGDNDHCNLNCNSWFHERELLAFPLGFEFVIFHTPR
jgi:hypothetical protein